jgi:hypothetical protein
MGSFSNQLRVRRPAGEVFSSALKSLNEPLDKIGFKLTEQDPQHVVWTRKKPGMRAMWADPDRIMMSFADAGNGETLVTIAGQAPPRIAQQFEKLRL